MQAYRREITLANDGTLTLTDLPFRAGDRLEIIVLGYARPEAESARYPLRGKPIRYDNPTDPLAESDWEALQ
jgi:hypothetical protein